MDQLKGLWEDTDKKLSMQRLRNQSLWTNPERSRGTMIDSNEMIRRVLKMNPKLWVEDARLSRDRAGFYFAGEDGEPRFTGAHWQKGMIREHVLVYVDRADLPTGYELGWREILLRLLEKKLIKLADIPEYFPVFETQLSGPYDQRVQESKT
jgi:hypothetical protein